MWQSKQVRLSSIQDFFFSFCTLLDQVFLMFFLLSFANQLAVALEVVPVHEQLHKLHERIEQRFFTFTTPSEESHKKEVHRTGNTVILRSKFVKGL